MSVKNAILTKVGRASLMAQKNAPNILFAVGLAGMGATVISAVRGTLKLESTLETIEDDVQKAKRALALQRDDYNEPDFKRDIFLIYVKGGGNLVKIYTPTIVFGSLTVLALTKSHNILNTRNAALTAAYAAVDRGFKEYRQRVIDDLGADKDREYRYELESGKDDTDNSGKRKKKRVVEEKIRGGSIYARIFDEYNSNYSQSPEYNIAFLRGVQAYANQRLRARGHLFLNEVYDDLGMERSPAGSQVGWLWGKNTGDGHVDFGIFSDVALLSLHDFVTGREGGIMLDFNVDGVIYDQI